MHLITNKVGDVLIVSIESDLLNSKDKKTLQVTLEPLLLSGIKVALDLSRLKDADVSGFESLVSLYENVKKTGGEIKVFSLKYPSLRSLYEKLCLHKKIETFNHKEEALSAFARVD